METSSSLSGAPFIHWDKWDWSGFANLYFQSPRERVDGAHSSSAAFCCGPVHIYLARRWLFTRILPCRCGLPATTNTTDCLHCNVVVHNWCKEVSPSGLLSPPQARPKRSGRRTSTIPPPKQQQQSKARNRSRRNQYFVVHVTNSMGCTLHRCAG